MNIDELAYGMNMTMTAVEHKELAKKVGSQPNPRTLTYLQDSQGATLVKCEENAWAIQTLREMRSKIADRTQRTG